MIWAFAECELDEHLYQLRRRGQPVKLEPKVFDVLHFLLRERQRVVGKNELLDALWAGEHVSESVLPRCVAAARRAVGDDRGSQRVLQTVHGRGYRFVAAVEGRAAPVPPPLPRRAEPRTGHGAFFGRELAMRRLEAALEDALSGRGRVALVVGEPGIGKTRLLEELGGEARRRGARWLDARCHEAEGTPAFWPWRQMLRLALDKGEGGGPAREIGSDADERAAFVPELREALPELPAPALADGADARFRLFETLADYLSRAARRQPLVLAVDDLHAADADSLWLFELLAAQVRDMPILLLGSYRDVDVRRSHPLARVLGALARHDHCERVTLRGLDRDAVAAVFESIAGVPPAPQMIAAVVEMTDGNPFFVHELVRLLAEEGRAGDDAAQGLPLALPQGARDAIGRRLDTLSADCNEVLRAAAVFGRELTLPLLERVVDRTDDALLELLGEALAAHVLVELPGGAPRFAFRHALLRQALYEELSMPQRVALHRRVAEALETAFGTRPDAPAAELAHHFFAAAPAGTAEAALRWSEIAAARAHEVFAYEESARHYGRALEALDLAVPADETRRCELLIALGEELWTAGARERADPPLAAAAELARRIGRVDLLARAAIAQHGLGTMGVAAAPRTLSILAELRETLGEDHPALRARVLARLAGTPPQAVSMRARERLSSEAWAMAERAADRAAWLDAVNARYWATLGPERIDERLAVAREALGLAERFGDRRFEVVAREIAIGAHLLRGNLAEADCELRLYEDGAEALQQPALRFLAGVMRASRQIDVGDFAAAELTMGDAHERARSVAPHAPMLFAAQSAWLALQRGEWQRLADSLTATAPLFLEQRIPAIEPLLRLLPLLPRLASRESDELRRALDAEVASVFEDDERDEHWLLRVGLLAYFVFRLEASGCAERLYDALLPYRQLMVSHDLLRTILASAETALGLLAAASGRWEVAVSHLEAGLAREEVLCLRPVALRTRELLADVLSHRDAPGDRARANALRRQAAEAARGLGCRTPVLPGPAPGA